MGSWTDFKRTLSQAVDADDVQRHSMRVLAAKMPDLFKAARAHLHLSQTELADKLGVHHTYISKIEHGLMPGLPMLKSLNSLINNTKGG